MQIPDDLKFDPGDLTWAHMVFIGRMTGRTVLELQQVMTSGEYTPADLAAVASIAVNTQDPDAGWAELANQRITDFQLAS